MSVTLEANIENNITIQAETTITYTSKQHMQRNCYFVFY